MPLPRRRFVPTKQLAELVKKDTLQRLRSALRLSRRAQLISRLAPVRWFPLVVHLSRLQWNCYRVLWWRPDILLRTSVLLDVYLHDLNQLGRFPLPWRITGKEYLPQPDSLNSGRPGVLYCASHVPFFSAHARVLWELGAAPSLVIALANAITPDGGYPMPGIAETIPALPPSTSTLVKVRRALQGGAVVGSMIDAYPGGPLKPQLLRLAGKTGSRVVFLFSELDRNRHMRLIVAEPPFPLCDTEEKVQANLAAYARERSRILRPFRAHDPRSEPRSH